MREGEKTCSYVKGCSITICVQDHTYSPIEAIDLSQMKNFGICSLPIPKWLLLPKKSGHIVRSVMFVHLPFGVLDAGCSSRSGLLSDELATWERVTESETTWAGLAGIILWGPQFALRRRAHAGERGARSLSSLISVRSSCQIFSSFDRLLLSRLSSTRTLCRAFLVLDEKKAAWIRGAYVRMNRGKTGRQLIMMPAVISPHVQM